MHSFQGLVLSVGVCGPSVPVIASIPPERTVCCGPTLCSNTWDAFITSPLELPPIHTHTYTALVHLHSGSPTQFHYTYTPFDPSRAGFPIGTLHKTLDTIRLALKSYKQEVLLDLTYCKTQSPELRKCAAKTIGRLSGL